MVIYDSDAALQRALAACNQLLNSVWSKVEVQFHWWRTRYLNDRDLAADAAQQAAKADLFIFSSQSEVEPTQNLKDWFREWIGRRSVQTGALANLITSTSLSDAQPRTNEPFLRDVCHQAKLEFLGTFPSPA